MRTRTNNKGIAKHLATALAVVVVTLVGFAAPVLAQDDPPQPINPPDTTPIPTSCFGSGDHDDSGGTVIGSCFGNSPGTGPSTAVSSKQVWEWYRCHLNAPEFVPGSLVRNVIPTGPLSPQDIIDRGLDPTAQYGWYLLQCWLYTGTDALGNDLFDVFAWGFLVIETSPPVDPIAMRDGSVELT